MFNTIKKGILFSIISALGITMVGCSHKSQPKIHHKIKNVQKAHHISKLRPHPNYKLSSERVMYPRLNKHDIVLVSIPKQRAYIKTPIYKHHKIYKYKIIYTMFISTGSHNRTPKGTYHINNVRTAWFYSPKEHEGAKYAVGWHDGGVYLFHATPANQRKQVYKNVAKQLGRKPSSHGCIHLTVPDAKWFSTHAVTGMKVIIK